MKKTKIYHIRKLSGLTQEVVAQKLCITTSYLFMLETGRRNPSLRVVNNIRKFCNRYKLPFKWEDFTD